MTSGHDINAVPFGGSLGDEFKRVWEAIRANQVVPTAGQRVSRTTGGTMVRTVGKAGAPTSAAPGTAATGGAQAVWTFRDDQRPSTHAMSAVDADGWIIKPWVAVSGQVGTFGNMLLAPLTNADIEAAKSAWGAGGFAQTFTYPDGYLAGTVGKWGGVSIANPGYIGNGTPGKWQSPRQLPLVSSGTPAHFIALELSAPFPAGFYTDIQSGLVDLPEIHHIQIHPPVSWIPTP